MSPDGNFPKVWIFSGVLFRDIHDRVLLTRTATNGLMLPGGPVALDSALSVSVTTTLIVLHQVGIPRNLGQIAGARNYPGDRYPLWLVFDGGQLEDSTVTAAVATGYGSRPGREVLWMPIDSAIEQLPDGAAELVITSYYQAKERRVVPVLSSGKVPHGND